MIARTTAWQDFGEVYSVPEGECAAPNVPAPDHSRISELLGPDGEPLRVGYERPKIGFDLTPKGSRP